MNRKINPVAIGIFVVGATMLGLISIAVFGGAKIFTKTETVVCFFQDGVNGLDIGAPVKYKGVKIGKVKDITINIPTHDMRKTTIAVVLSIDMDVAKRRIAGGKVAENLKFDKQVDEGLRAKLAFQSIVTGMLYVELDYYAEPGEPYRLYARRNIQEIPIAESGLTNMAKKFEDTIASLSEVNFQEIGDNLNSTILLAQSKLNQMDVKTINDKLVSSLDNVQKITSNPKIEDVINDMDTAFSSIKGFADEATAAVHNMNRNSEEMMGNMNEFIGDLRTIFAPDTPFRYEFAMLIKNLGDTALSVKALADYLERNPNSILTGKPAKRSNDL